MDADVVLAIRCCARSTSLQAASGFCGDAVKINQHSFDAAFYNGRALAATPAAAASEFRRATGLDPTSYQAWYHLANNLLQADKTGNLKEAVAAYVRV